MVLAGQRSVLSCPSNSIRCNHETYLLFVFAFTKAFFELLDFLSSESFPRHFFVKQVISILGLFSVVTRQRVQGKLLNYMFGLFSCQCLPSAYEVTRYRLCMLDSDLFVI